MKSLLYTTIRLLRLLGMIATLAALLFSSTGHVEGFEECPQEDVSQEAEFFASRRDEHVTKQSICCLYHLDSPFASPKSMNPCIRFQRIETERDQLNGHGAYLRI